MSATIPLSIPLSMADSVTVMGLARGRPVAELAQMPYDLRRQCGVFFMGGIDDHEGEFTRSPDIIRRRRTKEEVAAAEEEARAALTAELAVRQPQPRRKEQIAARPKTVTSTTRTSEGNLFDVI